MVTLYVDTREKSIPPLTSFRNEFNVENKHQSVGDYVIVHEDISIHIELKIRGDYFSSMFNGRLSAQLADLSKLDFGMVAFVGDFYDPALMQYVPSTFGASYPQGNISSMLSTFRPYEFGNNVSFYQFRNMREFEMGLLYLSRKLDKGKFIKPAITGKDIRKGMRSKMVVAFAEGEFIAEMDENMATKMVILTSADGIGIGTAKLLLDRFDSDLAKIFRAHDKSITGIKGVGPKVLKELRNLQVLLGIKTPKIKRPKIVINTTVNLDTFF